MSTDANGTFSDEALLDQVADEFADAPDLANPAATLLEQHFGTASLGSLAVASDTYLPIVNVHLQNALEKFVSEPGRESSLHGLALPVSFAWQVVPLTQLIAPPTLTWPGPSIGSPDYVHQQTSTGNRSVLRRGLYLTKDAEGSVALWVSQGAQGRVAIDVMAPTEERVRAVVDQLRAWSYELNPFQGQMLTITINCPGDVIPIYLDRPQAVGRDEVVLPDGLLDRIEEQAVGAARNRDELVAAGHSLKRGILMHGRPGTGKTHTIRYLISQMPDYTVVLMPAGKMAMFSDRLGEIVPYVTPGIMIFDDVDLIAEDRSHWFTNPDRGPLFTLLELLDGIGVDADLLFILTTNVADRLEEAIAARPGRIDQAFEIPPPDADCRRRLLELYAKDVKLDLAEDDLAAIIDRMEGVTGSFLKELVRRATVVATMDLDLDEDDEDDDFEDDDLDVDDDFEQVINANHLSKALDQLLDPTNEVTARLLGAQIADPTPSIGRVAAALQRR